MLRLSVLLFGCVGFAALFSLAIGPLRVDATPDSSGNLTERGRADCGTRETGRRRDRDYTAREEVCQRVFSLHPTPEGGVYEPSRDDRRRRPL